MDRNCLIGFIVLGGYNVIISGLFLDYRFKADKKSIELEKNDLEHEKKHAHNEGRIKELEKKNGHELHEIELLKSEINTLKEVIKNKSTIVNNPKKESGNIPNPPPPPKKTEPKEKPSKKGNWQEIHDQIKKRRKDLGEEEN